MVLVEKEKTVPPHHLHHHQQQHAPQHFTSVLPGIKSPSLSEETRKPSQQQPPPNKINTVLSPDLAKSKMSPNQNLNPAQLDSLKHKLQHTSNSQCHPYSNATPTDLLKTKQHPSQLDISKPKPNTSPEVSKHKIPRYSDTSPPSAGRLSTKGEIAEPSRSGFKPVPARSESGGVSTSSSSTKSPLIIDKNETFTVYRDPALVRSDAENSASATVSSNHVAAYLHPHLHNLHSPSPHSPCLTPASHSAPHLLAPPHSSTLPHPHLLPPGVLPAMPPPAASLLGGHPRLDSPGGLGHLAMPHPAATHQQQFLQVWQMYIDNI